MSTPDSFHQTLDAALSRSKPEHECFGRFRDLYGSVWCVTCQHEHIPDIPVVTFACAACGFGVWKMPLAVKHAEDYPGHIVYANHHQTAELPAPATVLRDARGRFTTPDALAAERALEAAVREAVRLLQLQRHFPMRYLLGVEPVEVDVKWSLGPVLYFPERDPDPVEQVLRNACQVAELLLERAS